MKLALVAVGQRLPPWAHAACDDYLPRMPADWRVELTTVKAEPRTLGKTVQALKAAEAQRLLAACARGARKVVLDERGQRLSTAQLADLLRAWQRDGRDVALLIGGPDGLDDELKAGADDSLRLSDLTLPHALARVLLIEALYRAGSLLAGHPYHRA